MKTKQKNDFYIPKDMFADGCLENIGRIFEVQRLEHKIPYSAISSATHISVYRLRNIEKARYKTEEVNFSEILHLYAFFKEKIVIIDKDFWLEEPSK